MFEQFYTMQTYPLKPVVAEAEVTVVSDTNLHEVVKKIKIKKRPNTPDSKYSDSKQTGK